MKPTKYFLLAILLLTSAFGVAQQVAARQLVERQARAWEKQDFTLGASDWLPTAVLMSPEGNTAAPQMPASMKDYFKDFGDLHVTIRNVFASPDGKKLAIEWDWAITRKKDGKRGVSHDAIIVDLINGKIASWREYYDPAASGEANP
ncbi:MAG: nuclear transport factor 2 family protein [Acidobacteriaceae bacterium]